MSLAPYVTALVETIARGSRREPPAGLTARLAEPALTPSLRAVLAAWAEHEGAVRIGDLALDPACLDRPVPDASGGERSDLLRIGELDSGDLLAVQWPPGDGGEIWWVTKESDWQAEDFGGLEEFLAYRVTDARTTHGATELDAALGWPLVKASLGPYVASLLETIESRPRRAEPLVALRARLAGQALAPDLRGLLEAWVLHDGTVSIGDLTLDATCMDQRVPDKSGNDRADLLSLGVYECGDLVVAKWPPAGQTRLGRAVHDAGWSLEKLGNLESFLKKRIGRLRDKGDETDLDAALAKRKK